MTNLSQIHPATCIATKYCLDYRVSLHIKWQIAIFCLPSLYFCSIKYCSLFRVFMLNEKYTRTGGPVDMNRCQYTVTGWGLKSQVWDVIFQWSSTMKLSIGLTVTTTHRRDMTERLLKTPLNTNQSKCVAKIKNIKTTLKLHMEITVKT